MKLKKLICIVFLMVTFSRSMVVAQEAVNEQVTETSSLLKGQMMGMGSGWLGIGEKSPGIAALLSLQPMPVAVGNFYAEDWEKGILYSTLELGMFIPAMILLGERNSNHSHYNNSDHSWTNEERAWFYSLLTGYIVTKMISAFDAGHSVEKYLISQERVSINIVPKQSGWALKTSMSF